MNVFDTLRADIETRVRHFQEQNGGPPDPPEYLLDTTPRCPVCRDSGWTVAIVGEPVQECSACDIVAARRRQKFGKLGPTQSPYDRYTFDEFPVTTAAMKNTRTHLATLSVKRPSHVFLWGPVGSGKTSLASCLYRAWQDGGAAGMWFTVPGLLDAIRAGFDRETRTYQASDLVAAVCSVPLLLLDDLGAERVTDWVAGQLYSVVNSREERPTIFTSNLDLAGLCDRLGGLDGERIVSRIQGMCAPHIYHVDGPDLRQRPKRETA